MRKHRLARFTASLSFLASLAWLVGGILSAALLARRGLGAGWGEGWQGWIIIPIVVVACLGALALLTIGAVLSLLTDIDDDLDAIHRQSRSVSAAESLSATPARLSEKRMDNAMLAIVVAVGLSAVTVVGDYLLKRASGQAQPFASWWFVSGVAVYAATAFGWIFVMRYLSFATLGVVYAVATVLLLTLVGVLFLHESLRWQEVLGVALAVATVGLLARFA